MQTDDDELSRTKQPRWTVAEEQRRISAGA